MTAETAAYIMMSGGEGKNQDLLFHDILDKGTVIFEHDIANGYSFKVVAYCFSPAMPSLHYDMFDQGVYVTVRPHYGLKYEFDDGNVTVYSNQLVRLENDRAGAALYVVVYKDSVPLYALMQYSTEFGIDIYGNVTVGDGSGNFETRFFKEEDNFQITGINGGGSAGTPITVEISDTTSLPKAKFVTGEYSGGVGCQINYSYQIYDVYYDTDEQKYYQKKTVVRSDSKTLTISGICLIPNMEKSNGSVDDEHYITRIHTDCSISELESVFQGVIDAMRSEANIASYPIKMLEVID